MHRTSFRGVVAVVLMVAPLGVAAACSSKGKGTGGAALTTSTTGAGAGSSTGNTSGTASTSSNTTTTTASTGTSMQMVGDSVLMHHKNPSRDGVYIEPALTKAAVATLNEDASFKVTLPDSNDAVYAQPLFVDGNGTGKDLVIVSTEANNVYALDASNGSVVWKTNVGTPVPLGSMSCGNIDPFGVTGTPVIDFGSRRMFLDALVLVGNKPTHQIFSLNIDTGAQQGGWPITVNTVAKSGGTTFSDPQQGERGALLMVGTMLYVPFGGLYGDCNPYHGWVLAIDTTDPTKVQAWTTKAAGGGIWSPAGLSSDGTYIFAGTGNTFGANNTWGGGNALIRLGTGAAFSAAPAFFAPKNWQALDNTDLDMGTIPVTFDLAGSTPSQLAIMFGKDGNAYLIDRNNPGGVSNALGASGGGSDSLHVASSEIITAPVVYSTATATYSAFRGNGSACKSGSGDLTAVTIKPGSPPTVVASWCASAGSGSPMVTTTDGHANAIVWVMGADADDHLHAFDGDTGAAVPFAGSNVQIPNMRRFNTPIAAKGRIFVAADQLVVAFKP